MPRIFGLNVVGLIAASIAYYMVGFLWYGAIFMDAWMTAQGVSVDGSEPQAGWMIAGFVITVMQVIGIGKVLQWRNADSLGGSLGAVLTLWLLFALPFVCYSYIYLPAHSQTLLMIDASHFLVGWLVIAVILKLLK